MLLKRLSLLIYDSINTEDEKIPLEELREPMDFNIIDYANRYKIIVLDLQ